jgi:phage minor structural protein
VVDVVKPRLYAENETEFESNGLGPLSDALACTVEENRNGAFELTMDYPVTGALFDELKHGSIIFAPANDSGTPQPFRVCEKSTPLSGVVTIRAKHISYQLSHIPVSPFAAGSCTAALQGLKSHAVEQCPFDFWTDKESTADFSVEQPASARSLLGGVTGSVLDVYGGEYEFDRYTVKLHNARGHDSGVVIAYGKNLVDLNQEESIENTITGVYPYYKGADGNVLELPEKVVSSESAQNFPYPRTVPLDCSQVWQEVPTIEQLRAYATSYVKKEGIGVPSVSLKVSFVPLWQTDEYKAIAPAERLNLCDIATVRFEKLGVNARAKVVQTVYDVLAGRYESVTLGEASTNLADTIVDQDKAISEKPSSSELEAAAANATAWITGNKGGYVVLRKNADGQPYELLIMDKPTIEEAVKVWRFNNSGLGYSSTGYNGTYGLAMTQDGQIVADYITTGTLTANLIRTGVIKSLKDDTFFFDIDTGELKINAKSLQINSKGVYDGETVDSKISESAEQIKSEVSKSSKITGGGNLILGSESFKNAELKGNAVSGSSATYNDTGSATVINANSNRYFHWQTVNEHVSAGVTLCLSVMYKPVSGTDELCMEINYNNTWAVIKAADQIEIKQTNGWVLRYGLWTPSSDAIVKWVDIGSGFTHAGMGNYTNKFELLHPMLQYGNAPTAWTASTGDYLTANETKTEIKQTVGEIKLTASTSGTSSTIKLTAGGTEITSAQINLSGMVTFSDLSTWNQDKTIINGGNITTGQIHNLSYSTVYDLDNAYIRMGTESGERVFVDSKHIAWYAKINTGDIGLTGVLSSEAGRSYFGASSKYMSYGWVDGLDPSTYCGMQVTYNRSDDSDVDFNSTRVGVSGTLNCKNLNAWGSKSRIVPTSFGPTKMAAFETPIPMFADIGHGECGPDGWCLIVPDPRYAETVAQNGRFIWLLTDCTGNGSMWAEDCGQYAIVHGAAGQHFSWMAVSAQRGYEGEYAEPSECNYPSGMPAGADYAASEAARASNRDEEVADALLDIDTGADSVIDTLLEEYDK